MSLPGKLLNMVNNVLGITGLSYYDVPIYIPQMSIYLFHVIDIFVAQS